MPAAPSMDGNGGLQREVIHGGAVRLSIGCELSVEEVYRDPRAEPA